MRRDSIKNASGSPSQNEAIRAPLRIPTPTETAKSLRRNVPGVQRTYNAHTRYVKSILLVYRVNLVDRSTEDVKNPLGTGESRMAKLAAAHPLCKTQKRLKANMNRKAHFHYLDHASMGRPTRRTLERLHTALSDLGTFASTGTLETIRQFEALDRARERVAKFIHADPSNILLVGNTTEALGTIATALPMSRGDNILMADIEFMGATVAWRGACQRAGVEIVPVKTEAGKVFAEQFAARANSRTRAILISSVQEISGWRSDLRAIGDVAAKSGAFVIADGIQETGARPVDFQELAVDAFCAGGHKWLRSPFGLGFACIGPRLLDVLQPAYQGYLALAEPVVGWDRYMELPERTPFDLPSDRTDAGRLETGGYPNWLGAMGLDAAIEDFQKLGPERSWKRIKKLRSRLVAGLRELGIGFLGGPDPPEDAYAGMLTFCLPGGAAQEKKLLEEMKKARVFASLRYVSGIGGIRTAVHESNSYADVDALLDVTRRFLKKPVRKKR